MEFQVLKCLYYLTCIQLLLFQVYQFCIIKTKLSLFQLQLLLLKFLTQHPCVKQCKFYLMLQQPLVTQGQMISQQAKLSSGLLSNEWGITRELDKEPLLHCSSIYITYKWSVLQQYYSCPNVHASSSCPITHPHVFSIRPPCFLHVS